MVNFVCLKRDVIALFLLWSATMSMEAMNSWIWRPSSRPSSCIKDGAEMYSMGFLVWIIAEAV